MTGLAEGKCIITKTCVMLAIAELTSKKKRLAEEENGFLLL